MPPQPSFGPHNDDSSVEEFLSLTYGQIFFRDPEELAKIDVLAHAYAKVTKIFTVEDLMLADRDAHIAALSFALDGPEISGTLSFILKYLGRKGVPHVTPGECVHLPELRLPACPHVQALHRRASRVVCVRAVMETFNTGLLASEAAAKKAIQFGKEGAGGPSNEKNFATAWRTSTVDSAEIDVPDWLSFRLDTHLHNVPFKPPKDSNPMLKLKEIIWDVSEWLVNDFGASPATACQGILGRASYLVLARLNARHTDPQTSPPWVAYQEKLAKAIGSRVGEFRRGGVRGVTVEISLDECHRKSPMKLLIADGKVSAVSRGLRGHRGRVGQTHQGPGKLSE